MMAWNIKNHWNNADLLSFRRDDTLALQGISVGELPDRGELPDGSFCHKSSNPKCRFATNVEKFGTPLGWRRQEYCIILHWHFDKGARALETSFQGLGWQSLGTVENFSIASLPREISHKTWWKLEELRSRSKFWVCHWGRWVATKYIEIQRGEKVARLYHGDMKCCMLC